jgi:hypothetical protein
MKRIKLVIAVAAVMAMMIVAAAAPAIAKGNNDSDRHLDQTDIRFDRQLQNDNFGFENEGFFPFAFENFDFFPFGFDDDGVFFGIDQNID